MQGSTVANGPWIEHGKEASGGSDRGRGLPPLALGRRSRLGLCCLLMLMPVAGASRSIWAA